MKKLVDIAVMAGGFCFIIYGLWQIYPPLMWIYMGVISIAAVIFSKNWIAK